MSMWNFYADTITDAVVTLTNTNETTVLAAKPGIFQDVLSIWIVQGDTSPKTVTIRDGTSGTTRFVVNLPGTVSTQVSLPMNFPIPAAAANANWTAQQSAGTSCQVFMQAVRRGTT